MLRLFYIIVSKLPGGGPSFQVQSYSPECSSLLASLRSSSITSISSKRCCPNPASSSWLDPYAVSSLTKYSYITQPRNDSMSSQSSRRVCSLIFSSPPSSSTRPCRYTTRSSSPRSSAWWCLQCSGRCLMCSQLGLVSTERQRGKSTNWNRDYINYFHLDFSYFFDNHF